MEVFEILQEVWAVRALIASGMVGIMCGALGAFIVLRNMSLIGDALSHAILPGVVLAFIIVGYSALGFFTGAVLAGLFAAVGITWIQHNIETKNDAAIGIVFTAMFSIGVIGISWISRNEGVHLDLKDFLFGNVLGVQDQDLILTTVITVFVVVSIIVLYRYLFISTFQPVIAETMGISVKFIHYFLMLMLSFAVVAALQTVGVILVVAMLITPASTSLLLSSNLKHVIVISALLGFLSAVCGLLLSIIFETTPGPAMAVVTTIFYLIAAVFAPRKGLLAKKISRRRQQLKIEKEDILKVALKLQLENKLNRKNIETWLDIRRNRIARHLKDLQRQQLLLLRDNEIALLPEGKERAYQLIRAHRLWETYLANQVGLSESQIHEDAERYEHLLTDEILDEVDKELGFPRVDPHGSPIPKKSTYDALTLADLDVMQHAVISPLQQIEKITQTLWQKRLGPDVHFTVLSKSGEAILIDLENRKESIPIELARKIHVEVLPTGVIEG